MVGFITELRVEAAPSPVMRVGETEVQALWLNGQSVKKYNDTMILHTVVSKDIKCLGMNWTKNMQEPLNEKY